MRSYLKSIIEEQIHRAKYLIELTAPIEIKTLLGLSVRCRSILEDCIYNLNLLKDELDNQNDDILVNILRAIKLMLEKISIVEYYGISALYIKSAEIEFLNDLIHKIHLEINLPFEPPAVCCTSNKYYYSYTTTNTIFVPLAEAHFLLHLSDLFHEIGHFVIFNFKNYNKLKPLREAFEQCEIRITEYYSKMIQEKTLDKLQAGPGQIIDQLKKIYSKWRTWLKEYFCDLFALYTLGPAYAWSHLHLTTKLTQDINLLDVEGIQTHPSDGSRMKMIMYGLEMIGIEDELLEVKTKWENIKELLPKSKDTSHYAYPKELMRDIAEIIHNGIDKSSIELFNLEIKYSEGFEIISLLNEAWNIFWQEGHDFREWELEKLQELHSSL